MAITKKDSNKSFIKTENQISLEEITNNLISLSNKEIKFKPIPNWRFPDFYNYNPTLLSESLILMTIKGNKTALLSFSVTNKNISINYIQGIKNKKFKNRLLNKHWSEIFLDRFILSASKFLFVKNHTLNFHFFKNNPNHINFVVKNRNDVLRSKEEYKLRIDEFLSRIKDLQERLTNSELDKTAKKKIRKYIEEHKAIIESYKQNIISVDEKIKLYGGIRDRYLDKNGKLNFNKERVKKIKSIFLNNPKRIYMPTPIKKKRLFRFFRRR